MKQILLSHKRLNTRINLLEARSAFNLKINKTLYDDIRNALPLCYPSSSMVEGEGLEPSINSSQLSMF